jgi:hypothetical protein
MRRHISANSEYGDLTVEVRVVHAPNLIRVTGAVRDAGSK